MVKQEDKNQDGQALKDRVQRVLDSVKPEEWQKFYELLSEYQLLGTVLLLLESVED